MDKFEKNNLYDIRSIDGELVNVDPLPVIPESKMKLYTVCGILSGEYFNSFGEFNDYIKNNDYNFLNVGIVEYIGECAGRKDVIRFTSLSGHVILISACDEYGYVIYNNKRSVYRGDFVWEYNYGKLFKVYKAFRDRGSVFENDIYLKNNKRSKRLCKRLERSAKK